MKKVLNNKNNKKVVKNQGKKFNGNNRCESFKSERIDIDSLYAKLKASLENRAKLQTLHDNEWRIVRRRGVDRTAELKELDSAIGAQTHAINELLNQLCQYRKTHRAMNLAYDYVCREISRIERIVSHWHDTISSVDAGYGCLLDSHGGRSTDTTDSKRYVAKKQMQLNKLCAWKKHIEHYRVA